MKAIKRTIASLLASLMLLSSVNVSFAAETYTEDEAVVVAKVNAAGIMTGTDNGFEPSKTLTRAEAAAIMVRMKGIPEAQVKSAAGTTLFGDVSASHWAAGYINVASSLGIIKGVGANEFAPDRTVTIAEMTTMAVRALGAGQLVDAQAGTWPTNYMNFAGEEKLTDGVFNVYTAEATRINAATIVANTLEADMWEKSKVTTNNEVTWEKQDRTILSEILEISVYDEDNAEKCISVSNTDHTFEGETLHDVVETLDLSNVKVGMTYDFWKNEDDEIIGIWESESNKGSKVEFEEIVKYANDEITLLVNGKEKKYDLASANINDGTDDEIVVVYNEEDGSSSNLAKNANASGVAYIENGDVTSIYITEFDKYGVIDEVTSTKVKFETTDVDGEKCSNFTINDEDNEYFLTKDGKALAFTDLENGDAIKYYTITANNSTKYVAEVITDVIEGEVTAVGSDYVKIDGKKYDTALRFTVDDEVRVWLNAANDIIMSEEIESAASDLAVVKYIRKFNGKHGDEYEIELFLTDGTTTDTLTVDLEETYDEYEDAEASESAGMNAGDTETSDKEDEARTLCAATKPGMVVAYEISGDKVILKPAKNDADLEEIVELDDGDKLNIGTKSYVKSGSKTIYVNENTTFIKVKADDTYTVKCEVLDFEDLDDSEFNVSSTPGSEAYSYVLSYDVEEKEAEVVIFGADSDVARTSNANFAYVLEVSRAKYDDETAYEVDVILNGEKTMFISTKDELGDKFDDFVVGEVVDLSVSGNLITNVDRLGITNFDGTTQNSLNGQAANDDKLGVVSTTPGIMSKYLSSKNEMTIDGTAYSIAEQALVLSFDEDDEDKYNTNREVDYTVRSIDDIDEFDNAAEENDIIKQIWLYQNDDSEIGVIAIVFERDDTTVLAEIADCANGDAYDKNEATLIDLTNAERSVSNDGLVVTYTAKAGYKFKAASNYTNVAEGDGTILNAAGTVEVSDDLQTLTVTFTEA